MPGVCQAWELPPLSASPILQDGMTAVSNSTEANSSRNYVSRLTQGQVCQVLYIVAMVSAASPPGVRYCSIPIAE